MGQSSAFPSGSAPASGRDDSVDAATSCFNPTFLALYDWGVLGFVTTFAWRCPSRQILALYNRYVSANHLDVGVGTGYFLNHCRFPDPSPAITLLDAYPDPLRVTARRLRRYRPRTRMASVLEPIDIDGMKFDSVGLGFLLHCLPGSFSTTKAAVFENLKRVLNEGGVVFGSTILGKDVPHNALGRRILGICNGRGIFSNMEDDPAGLERALASQFREYRVRIKGAVALFAARA